MSTNWHNPDGYDVNEHGTIQDPGKFESEAIYVPYFWDLDSSSDDVYVDDHVIQFYVVDDDDRAKFAGLLDDVYGIALDESDTGFVNSELFYSEDEYKTRVRDLENLPPSEPDEDDITTTDHEMFYQNGKPVLEKHKHNAEWYYRESRHNMTLLGTFGDNHVAAIRAYMDRVQFWPNVWFISDHGNAHLIDLSEGKE